ncbi:hypothetical protein KNE206_05790 [Kitasatospora sp. NE20-6]
MRVPFASGCGRFAEHRTGDVGNTPWRQGSSRRAGLHAGDRKVSSAWHFYARCAWCAGHRERRRTPYKAQLLSGAPRDLSPQGPRPDVDQEGWTGPQPKKPPVNSTTAIHLGAAGTAHDHCST